MSEQSYQSAFDAPPPDPELKRLEPLLGTWRTEGHTQHRASSVPASRSRAPRRSAGLTEVTSSSRTTRRHSAMNPLNEE
jgi:hypothetical protein